ncbi:MAG: 2-oxoacid:acceptor oxidoreductase family protein [Deltaproteobacteria bacterium]|nr:2-oxoacid:acceptor oxidoreductase family protein [Deltaproteobacteria bacterium]MBW2137724.1 2-oxoacid:acceptor oxidoreductase family protein [Deltaproteobacteria bacterium]
MYEIRFHGRGGQGAVLAAKILAKALVEEGKHVKAIPSFGFERRGAPVEAYLRFDERQIRQITNIYEPDCVVCLDPTLGRSVDIFRNLKDEGTWVQATKKRLEELVIPGTVARVGLCDAFGIALQIYGRTITNTIMLGALAKTTGMVSLEALYSGMASVAFRDADLEKNRDAVKTGYAETRVFEPGREECP